MTSNTEKIKPLPTKDAAPLLKDNKLDYPLFVFQPFSKKHASRMEKLI